MELYKDTYTSPPNPLLEDTNHVVSHPSSPLALYNSLVNTYCLFLIQYTSKNTLKPRWLLVQVTNEETATLQMNSLYTGYYHVKFLSRYPDNNHLCDAIAR